MGVRSHALNGNDLRAIHLEVRKRRLGHLIERAAIARSCTLRRSRMGTGYSRNAARAGWRESWPSTGRAFTAPAAQRAGSRSNAPHGKRPIATAESCSAKRESSDVCHG
jgi:hypothetical protein